MDDNNGLSRTRKILAIVLGLPLLTLILAIVLGPTLLTLFNGCSPATVHLEKKGQNSTLAHPTPVKARIKSALDETVEYERKISAKEFDWIDAADLQKWTTRFAFLLRISDMTDSPPATDAKLGTTKLPLGNRKLVPTADALVASVLKEASKAASKEIMKDKPRLVRLASEALSNASNRLMKLREKKFPDYELSDFEMKEIADSLEIGVNPFPIELCELVGVDLDAHARSELSSRTNAALLSKIIEAKTVDKVLRRVEEYPEIILTVMVDELRLISREDKVVLLNFWKDAMKEPKETQRLPNFETSAARFLELRKLAHIAISN